MTFYAVWVVESPNPYIGNYYILPKEKFRRGSTAPRLHQDYRSAVRAAGWWRRQGYKCEVHEMKLERA